VAGREEHLIGVGAVGDNAVMGNLWVATCDQGWVRADQIVHVDAEEERYDYSGKFDVVARTTTLTGSWRFLHEDPGDSELGPLGYTLCRCRSQEEALGIAEQVLSVLMTKQDLAAVLAVVDGKVVLQAIADDS
jgi:hypothetical protein